jgi:ArsR family transcriptional regulator
MNCKCSEATVTTADKFKALGHPARVEMVKLLSRGERCVCDLVESVGLGWSTVSRHLSVLKNAGIIDSEKRGLQVFYRIKLPCVGDFIECLEN